MKLSRLFVEFFESERATVIILVFVTIISLLLANSQWLPGYTEFRNNDLGGHSLVYLINDGLMSIFFLLIGLELEREIYLGGIGFTMSIFITLTAFENSEISC
jgi:Na+:H+ antiporter, NhaA family